ncbi:winged helix-turn-helix domain-containing protein [Pseudoalteromonas phenolica]|uniref:winged helix-turn-helix domain-containing protein n=1 Tax=Pseudoalteromonas phenolica TaxID=161398 RepID=UPI00110A2622|nr:winged helix-turn-helix domain-containing protein [Pseudoalteromonas phenolica]TMO57274.1 hypothetical protein CWC21_05180 [Pseudoalteromonas phenolica]
MDAFYLNQIFIDPSRNQIFHGDECLLIEPKAMTLLCVFAQQPNKVLSQKVLFEAIWEKRIFSSSSLQRLITLLRKALKDDPKAAQFIHTHAKRGYSLEVQPVFTEHLRLGKENKQEKQADKAVLKAPFYLLPKTLWLIALSLLFAASFSALFLPKTNSNNKQLNKPVAITHTSYNESMPTLSLNAQQLLFSRATESRYELVLKAPEKEGEYLLTTQNEAFLFAWLNNSTVALTKNEPSSGNHHLKLLTLADNQVMSERIIKVPSHITSFRALQTGTENSLYMLATDTQLADPRSVLIVFEEETTQFKILSVLPEDTYVQDFAFANNALYFTATKSHSIQQLIKYDLETANLKIIKNDLASIYHVAWDNHRNQLILSDTLKAGVLSISAHLLNKTNPHSEIKLDPFDFESSSPLSQIQVTENSIFGTTFQQDIDISSNNATLTHVNSKYEDYQASVSPSGEHLAFVSHKHGRPMLFVKSNEGISTIFDNPHQHDFISRAIWSSQDNEFAFAVGGLVYLYDLALKKLTRIESDEHIIRIDYWQTNPNQLIATTKQLNTAAIIKLETKKVLPFTLQGTVLYKDEDQQIIWQNDTIENLAKLKTWQPEQGEIVHAFSVKGLILAHVRNANESNLFILKTNLEVQESTVLPTNVQFISSAFFEPTKDNLVYFYSHWRNQDADIVKSDNYQN